MSQETETNGRVPEGFDPNMIGMVNDGASGTEVQTGELVQFISFKVEANEYAVNIMSVREIKGWTEVTALPNTPEYVRGVLNLRGIIVPIFDLRCRFGQGETDATALHVVVIIAVKDRILGILVDAVFDILTVNSEDIMAVPEIENRGDQRFLTGLLTVEGRMVATLDLERVFDLEALISEVSANSEKS